MLPQSQNRKQLPAFSRLELREAAQDLLPGFAVRRCQHRIAYGREGVDVFSDTTGRAWLEGAVPCQSVWTCPSCAARIADARAEDVQGYIDAALSKGHGVALVTLTFAHQKTDLLSATAAAFSKALKVFKSGRAAAALREKWGILGEIRAVEVTHGANGWHPHSHAILFTDKVLRAADLEILRGEMFDLWAAACKKTGLGAPTAARGVDIAGAKHAGGYVAKWGFATELTRGHLKKAQGAGRTPWQILADYAAGCARSGRLFREFAQQFKGKRQLFYSHGLKKAIGKPVKKPKQKRLDFKIRLTTVSALDWDLIVAGRLFRQLLHAAAGGRERLEAFLGGLRWQKKAA